MNLLKWIKLSLLVGVLLGGLALPAFSATQTVSSTADSGAGSLRQAITDATAGDTIVFNLTYPATITLSSTLSIAKNLSIKGPGVASLTISGNNAVRVFDITAGIITISDLTISNGRSAVAADSGGGIRLGGSANLTLDRCKVSNCSLTGSGDLFGGGISVGATATLTALRSHFYQNTVIMASPGGGGAINNLGTLTVVDSTFEGNSAYLGGALQDRANGKVVTLEGCTFSGNTSDNQGVVAHFGNSNFNVVNCTITKNYSTNGSNSYEAGLSVYNNSGTPGGTFTLKNTVVAGNVATTGGGDSDIYFDPTGLYSGGITFTFTSGGYNLIGSVGSNDAYYTWGTGDVRGTEASPQDANLATLASNGGYGSSHLPNVGSLAINPASSNSSAFVDGRGYIRAGATSEKGATEYLGTAPVATAASGITGSGFSANWNTVTGATGYLLDVATDTAFTAMVTGYWGLNVGNLLTYSVTGLSAGTTYYYRVRGYNSGLHHTHYTNTVLVNTTPPPTVTTGSASSITSTGATLNGTVNANGTNTTVNFDYGLTVGYGSSITASQSPVTGSTNTAVSASVSGLTCNTLYHFRTNGVSSGLTVNGSDATFTTGSCNSAPTDIALSASSINENVVANSTVGTLSSTDPDAGNTFTYTLVSGIGSTDNASFNISGGSLRITNSPNYEAKNSYSVRVRSTDQGGLLFEKAFTITIDNVVETPAISSIAPTSGSAAGGTSVVVTGTGLTGATAVKFGSTDAANFTVDSDTQITAVSPVGLPGTVDITVTTPDGTSATGASDQFRFSAAATSIVFDPNVTGKMYTALDGAGVYVSTNGGQAWTATTGQPGNLLVKQLAFHPTVANTLYAATYGGGVFTSANSGDSWTPCTNAASGSANAVSLAIDSTGKLYAGTEGGIFSSTDCSVWSAVNAGLTVDSAKPPVTVAIDPVTPSTLFTGLDGGGLYKKTSATNWTAVTGISASSRVKAIVMKDSANLYAAVYGAGVYKSNTSGDSWSACSVTGLTNTNLLSLEIDGNGYLYAGTEAGVFVSSDGCVSWTEMNNGLPN